MVPDKEVRAGALDRLSNAVHNFSQDSVALTFGKEADVDDMASS